MSDALTAIEAARELIEQVGGADAEDREWLDEAADHLTGAISAVANLEQAVRELQRLMDEAGILDRESSVSRQHYIDTGRYLTHEEVAELDTDSGSDNA